MKNLGHAILGSRVQFRFLMLALLLCLISAATPLSNASAPALSLRVVNNSGLEIRHLYLAPANTDDWGSDQLGGTPINPGVTRTLNVSWDQSSIKLIGEDQDGCFLTTTVEASSNIEWTITSDAPRNCGG